jgi:hypothetical protein
MAVAQTNWIDLECRTPSGANSGLGVLPFWLVVGAIAVRGTPRPTFERR